MDRDIERGEDNISRQRQIVARLIEQGYYSFAREADKLLEKFTDLQAIHLAHRDRLLTELGNQDSGN